MPQNFFVVNSENQNYASTRAQQWSGVVLVLGTSIVELGSITTSNHCVSVGIDTENGSIWTVKIAEWHTNEEDSALTYSDAGVENDLLRTGVVFPSSFLPTGVYVVVLPAYVPNQEKEVLSYLAKVLCEYGNFAMVVTSNGSNDGSKTASG